MGSLSGISQLLCVQPEYRDCWGLRWTWFMPSNSLTWAVERNKICIHTGRIRCCHVWYWKESFWLKRKITEFADAKILTVRIISAMNFITELRQKIQRPEKPHSSFWEFYLWLQLSNSLKCLIDVTLVFTSRNGIIKIASFPAPISVVTVIKEGGLYLLRENQQNIRGKEKMI